MEGIYLKYLNTGQGIYLDIKFRFTRHPTSFLSPWNISNPNSDSDSYDRCFKSDKKIGGCHKLFLNHIPISSIHGTLNSSSTDTLSHLYRLIYVYLSMYDDEEEPLWSPRQFDSKKKNNPFRSLCVFFGAYVMQPKINLHDLTCLSS